VGAALDIDGVILRGERALPGAAEALRLLRSHDVPFVFITNGGGISEMRKAQELQSIIGADAGEIVEEQVIVSHSPLKQLVGKFGDKRLLVLGCREEVDVARKYGFKKVVSPHTFAHQHAMEELYPMHSPRGHYHDDEHAQDAIEAIFVMHDPVDWHLEIQICLDVLLGHDPLSSSAGLKQHVPLFNTNDDLVYAGGYSYPRLAQGAFLLALEHLFKQRTNGTELKVERFGKPHRSTLAFAEKLLNEQSGENNGFYKIFMIGDNPPVDIRGANLMGKPWESILLRTGVFRDGEDDEDPSFIFDNILDAVKHITNIQEG